LAEDKEAKMYDKEFNILLQYAENKVDDMDIILSQGKNFSVQILNQNIESYKNATVRGLGVRIKKDGKIGYAYSEDYSEETLKSIVDEAIENSLIIEKEEMAIFDNYEDKALEFSTYDETLDTTDENLKIQLAKDLEKYAYEADPRVKNVTYAIYGDYSSYTKIANTKGLNKEARNNGAYAYTYLLVEENGERRNAMEIKQSKNFADFNAKEISDKAVEKALNLLGDTQIESGKYAVVFNNDMSSALLSTFSSIFSASAVHEGRSLLKGKMDQLIANPLVTIVDDARDENGLSSFPFDSEGYPTQTTVLVEQGVLKSFLHNTVTAHEDKVKSTGNASRSYKSSLGISPSNLKLIPGMTKKEDLLTSAEKVLEVVSLAGLHSGANPISGDFSLSGEGFLYMNGEKQGSLSPFTISGNYLQVLNNIEKIANDFQYNSESVGSASILVNELNISS